MSDKYKDSKLAPHPGMTETPAAEIPIAKLKLPPDSRWSCGRRACRAGARWRCPRMAGRCTWERAASDACTRSPTVATSARCAPWSTSSRSLPASRTRTARCTCSRSTRCLTCDGIAKDPNAQPKDLTAAFELPPMQHHNWKYVAFGPDGKLYVPFGAPCRRLEPTKEYAQYPALQRRRLGQGSHRDRRSQHRRLRLEPEDEGAVVHRPRARLDGRRRSGRRAEPARRTGCELGFPYCHADGKVDSEFEKADACKGVTRPVALLGPHAAAMGVKFYTGSMFPPSTRTRCSSRARARGTAASRAASTSSPCARARTASKRR